MPPSPDAFRDLLGGLDPEAFAAFVAALYEARGRETERVGDEVLVSDGEGTRRLTVRGAAPSPATDDAEADATVVPTVADDPDIVDADDLREMALYAVDEADRTRLFRRFFGVDPDEVGGSAPIPDDAGDRAGDAAASPRSTAGDAASPSPTPPSPTSVATSATPDPDGATPSGVEGSADDAATDDEDRLLARGPLLFGGVLLFVVVAAVALAVGPGPGLFATTDAGGETAGDAAANGTPATATPTADPAGVSNRDPPLDASDVEGVGGSAEAVEGPYPPGVGADGIENASTLAAAHEAELAGRSYRLSVVDREFVGGQPTAAAWERTVVEGPTRYRSTVEVAGTFQQKPRGVADATTYADGTERFVRLTAETDSDGTIRFVDRGTDDGTAGGDGWRSVAITREDDPVATRTASYLRRMLDVENSRLLASYDRDGTQYVWIELRARPPSGAVTLGSVLVDERGLVHELHYEYAYVPIGESSIRTTTTVRITTGNVTVTPPPWL